MNKKLIGLILAGGKSTRMGFDKRKLLINGQPVILKLAADLKKFCSRVMISCKKDDPVLADIENLYDEYSFGGPLDGIITALKFFPNHNILVLTGDQPFVSPEHLENLITKSDPVKPVTAFFNQDTFKPEPFPSLWKSFALESVEVFLKKHRPSPLDFMLRTDINVIQTSDKRFSINLNTPDDLRKFKEISGQ